MPVDIKYGIIILAAGNSSRLGRPKQLLPYHNRSLLQNAVEQSLLVPECMVMVVTGASREIVESELNTDHILVQHNAEWQTGMASSIKTGVSELLILYPSLDALLITVCDQPFLNAEILTSLITVYSRAKKDIVASAYNNTIGTPVLFSQKYFQQLQKLEGQEGAKKIIIQHPEDTTSVQFPLGEIDIDTADDYRRLTDNSD